MSEGGPGPFAPRSGVSEAPDRIVAAGVFRVRRGMLVDRSVTAPDGRPARLFPPAVLVIPRGGGPRDPYLVVLDSHGGGLARHLSGSLDFVDHHVVADADSPADRGWHDLADVLVCAGDPGTHGAARRVAGLLRRHPGCAVVACGDGSGRLIGTRDGRFIRVTGRVTAPGPAGRLGGYGSLVHAWSSAGLPLDGLAGALTMAGHHLPAQSGRPGRLLAAVRDHIGGVPAPPGRRKRPAA